MAVVQAEVWVVGCPYLSTAMNHGLPLVKGQLITLEGKLQTRSWDGKDGKKQYITEVVAHKVHVIQLGEQQASGPRRETAKAVEGSQDAAEDDIPF